VAVPTNPQVKILVGNGNDGPSMNLPLAVDGQWCGPCCKERRQKVKVNERRKAPRYMMEGV